MSIFRFKEFQIVQANTPLKVGADAMILGSLAQFKKAKHILDIGCGTGVLSLMQAQMHPTSTIDAVELNEGAFQDALANFHNAPFNNLGELHHVDFLKFQSSKKYDGFICNPPFYVDALKGQQADLNLAKHVEALTIDKLVEKASQLSNESAEFWIIWPFQDRSSLSKAFLEFGWHMQTETVIYGKPDHPVRIVTSWVKRPVNSPQNNSLTVRGKDGKYTAAYIELTKAFHDRDLSRP